MTLPRFGPAATTVDQVGVVMPVQHPAPDTPPPGYSLKGANTLPSDPQLAAALPPIRAMLSSLAGDDGIQRRRMLIAAGAAAAATDFTNGGAVRVEEHTIPDRSNVADVSVSVLSPSHGTGPWPAFFFVHGGGMVTGSRYTGVELLLPLIERGAVVVSVEYRLAPEHPDPTPVDDCYAALAWTAQHADKLSIDPHRISIVGVSAGGGLAAGTALMARDRGYPLLTSQVLICPMLDDRMLTPSSTMLDEQGTWDRHDNMVAWTALLADRRGGDDVSIYAAPARANDLSGLPRTYIDCGSAETFRDEAVDYAMRLTAAGVLVDLHMWGGGFHGFDQLVPRAAVSQACALTREDFLNRALTFSTEPEPNVRDHSKSAVSPTEVARL